MGRTLFQFLVDEALDEVDGSVNAEDRRVDAKIIRGGHAPSLVRIIVIVSGPRLVVFSHQLFGLLDRDAHPLDDLLDAGLNGAADEHAQAGGIVAQDIVGTTANEHARALVGYVAYRIALDLEERVVGENIVGRGEHPDERGIAHREGVGKGMVGPLVGPLENILAQAALLSRLGD